MWRGPRQRVYAAGNQFYETPELLARAVARIATSHAPSESVFFEVGVGNGALFRHLPSPKTGVELSQAPEVRFDGVHYGVPRSLWQSRLHSNM
jgi:hypothetical protein